MRALINIMRFSNITPDWKTVMPVARMKKVHCSKVSPVLHDYADRATIHGVGYLGDPR